MKFACWFLSLFAAASSLADDDYIPKPRPLKSDIEITAIYYPGTEHMPEWDMIAQTCPERKPLLGWYDEGNPEVIDWQIKWAVEHGITSFCVDWYWNNGHRRLEHWVKGFYKARFRSYLKWFMMYANHNQPGSHSTADQIAVTKYWIDNYFKTPEYYTIEGKPVVCIWAPGNIDRDFIAEAAARGETLAEGEGIKRAFAISEKMVRDAGLPGIYWIDMWRTTKFDAEYAKKRIGQGYRAAVHYGIEFASPELSPEALKSGDTSRQFCYDAVVATAPKLWDELSLQDIIPYWVILPTGWDDRPRSFAKNARIIRERTPEKFASLCRKAREFCDRHGKKHVIILPINEWQEGSYVEPNEEFGFGMYDAIREAFCEKPAEGWPENLTPSDVGRGPYDYPPMQRSEVQRWEFEKSTENWYRQPYGGGEVECREGCLTFVVNILNNFNVRQRLVPFASDRYASFRVRMKVTPNARSGLGETKNPRMRLKWGTEDLPIIGKDLNVDGRSTVSAPIIADGQWHEYELPLSGHPEWRGNVNELWFEAANIRHARVAVDWMRFLKSDEAAWERMPGFSPIVPVMLGVETTENLVKDLRRMKDEFGFSRFVLVGPDILRSYGLADVSAYERNGREIAEIKSALAGSGVEIGWWCEPTIRAGATEPWQRIMDCDGNITDSVCPLDEAHAADFARKLCAGLRLGRPDPIFIEDDFTLSNHGGMNAMKGCFCPLHLAAYEKKVGRAFSAKEIASMFRSRTEENAPLREAWADTARESLVWFASFVRREIDKIAPRTRVCLCQSGFVDIDGDSTEAVARAWAGATRPMVRVFGAGYWDENPPMNVAANIAHVFWSAQHLPHGFELLHETDAYPHTRFYNSSLFLVSEFAGALMAGVHDSFYYCLQYTDDPLSDTGYVQRMQEFRKRLAVARALREGARPTGVRMVYSPKEAYMIRETSKSASSGMLTPSTVFLAKLGFPAMTDDGASVATLFGNTADVLSDDEITELLKGGLFLDGEAAVILTKRGFGDLIGVTAVDDTETKIQFSEERILSPAKSSFRGRGVFHRRRKAKPILGWTRKRSVFAELKPHAGAVVWSAFFDPAGLEVAPSVVSFANSLGGRIGVMAKSVDETPPHMSFYTPRKQELFHRLFTGLSKDSIAVRAPKTPNTFVLASEKDGELLVMVNNLAGEGRDDVKLEFSPRWRGGLVERLDEEGRWTALPSDYLYQPMTPEFLRVKGIRGEDK